MEEGLDLDDGGTDDVGGRGSDLVHCLVLLLMPSLDLELAIMMEHPTLMPTLKA